MPKKSSLTRRLRQVYWRRQPPRCRELYGREGIPLRMPFEIFRRTCGWRIVISPTIPQDSPSCYHSSMRHLVVLFIHFLSTLVRLLAPGGVRSIVAESLLLKHQLLIVNRSRQRSPHLCAWDRILADRKSTRLNS